MKTIEEMIAVMTAYNEGKTIQYANVWMGDWEDLDDPHWDWSKFDYRVKPESKLRPYANAKEFTNAMKEHGPYITRDDKLYRIALTVFDDRVNYETTFSEYGGLIELGYKWQDGTPCGVVDEGGEG